MSRNHRVTVGQLGSGWAAIHVADYNDGDGVWYRDVVQTGIGRYATQEQAEEEARNWSESDGLELWGVGVAARRGEGKGGV